MLLAKLKNITKHGIPSALFELALIFIGISLALTFDNWNNDRNERALEREYLQSIYINLENNFKQIDDNLLVNADKLKASKNIYLFVLGVTYNEQTILIDLNSLFYYKTLSLESSGYTSIRSYGLHIIESPELRMAIVELHDRHFDRLITVWEGLIIRKGLFEIYMSKFIEYADFAYFANTSKTTEDWQGFFVESRVMRNIIIGHYTYVMNAYSNTPVYLGHIDRLMTLLEQRLNLPSLQDKRQQRLEFWQTQANNNWPIINPLIPVTSSSN
jgi:hypothetical protein